MGLPWGCPVLWKMACLTWPTTTGVAKARRATSAGARRVFIVRASVRVPRANAIYGLL